MVIFSPQHLFGMFRNVYLLIDFLLGRLARTWRNHKNAGFLVRRPRFKASSAHTSCLSNLGECSPVLLFENGHVTGGEFLTISKCLPHSLCEMSPKAHLQCPAWPGASCFPPLGPRYLVENMEILDQLMAIPTLASHILQCSVNSVSYTRTRS